MFQYEKDFQLIEQEDNMKPKNINSKELEDKYEENSKNPENIHQVMVHMPQDTVIEISNSNRADSNESLNPTLTEIIQEKELMDIIRKSLEDENAGDVEISNQPEDAPKKVRKSKRTVIQKSYLDFMSEDEEFAWDSTSWKDTDDSSSNEEELPKKKKTVNAEGKVGESGLKKKKENKAKKRKDARSKGEVYHKKDGSIRKERQLQPNPCVGKKCPWKCAEIDTEKRTGIFNYFWGLSNQRKKEWLIAMSSRQDVKRKRSKNSNYRTNTFNYFINDGEGRRQVCSKFLISTLDVTQRYIYYTLTSISQGISKEDGRGRCVPANKTPENVRESAKNFIKNLPALPSHYCRKDSTRLYLPTEFKNIKNLYRIYKEDRTSKGVDILSEKIFRTIFNTDFNIGFHVPKKDKCLKCLRFEGQNPTESTEMQAHLEEKQASKQRLECHRELGKENPSILCASFDLQKVLNTPHGNSMLLFYSRKYTVYNLCFYESITRNGFCFVWGETEGKRGANEIGTILQKYILVDVDSRTTVKTLILYSDSCPGQNKNKIVLAAVHNALLQSKHLETIQMNFLLPGHTEMTVDSIHSTIEHSVRNTIVWAPSQWATVCQLARKEPAPYYVENLTHTDFKNFEEFADKYFKSNLVGKISKIRTATFKKSSPNEVKIKYSMKNDAPEEKIPINAKPKSVNFKYKSSLAITKTKYNDLKKLCDTNVIPKIFHAEYLNLQTNNGKDELLDTDIEDETEEVN